MRAHADIPSVVSGFPPGIALAPFSFSILHDRYMPTWKIVAKSATISMATSDTEHTCKSCPIQTRYQITSCHVLSTDRQMSSRSRWKRQFIALFATPQPCSSRRSRQTRILQLRTSPRRTISTRTMQMSATINRQQGTTVS